MLKGIDPILSPDLLSALRAMGHRHDIAIVDANFPCDAACRPIRLDGVSATRVLDGVLSVFPLEREEPQVAWRMIADGQPRKMLPVFQDFDALIEKHVGRKGLISPVPPDDFKGKVRDAYAVVLTGELRLYGGIILRKGVIPAEQTS